MSLLIRGALLDGAPTNILIEGNRITYLGPEERPASRVLSGHGKAALPPLVNGHTHAAMTLFRGFGDDLKLQEWLETKIWPAESKLTEEDVYWGARLACLEMIKSGTTLFNDMYWHFHGTARAVEEMGLRAVISAVLIDLFDPQKSREQCRTNEVLWNEGRRYSSRVQFALGPHAIYTVSAQSLRWAADFAQEHDLLIHLHLSETEREVAECQKLHGVRPVVYLHRLGLLSPRLIAAHAVWLDDEELDLLASSGTKLVHNPTANLKLAVGGIFRYPAIAQRGIPVAIGTDGCASNNHLDMFESLKFAALVQKWKANDNTVLPCQEAWQIGTRGGASVLRVGQGLIAPGELADLILVNCNHVQMVPCHNLISNLIYAANGSIVDTVICDGQVLMEGRVVPQEEEILARAREVAQRIANG